MKKRLGAANQTLREPVILAESPWQGNMRYRLASHPLMSREQTLVLERCQRGSGLGRGKTVAHWKLLGLEEGVES